MLKKAKLKIAAWSAIGIMGAGSLFSGIAAQNVYAWEDTAVESVIDNKDNKDDSGNTDISSQINETQDSYSDTSADTLQSASVTEDNEENTPSESPEQNSPNIEKGTEEERSEDSSQDSTTGTDAQNNDNAKEFSGTGASKDTKAVEAKKNGWVKVKGGYKYYKNGKAYTGWHKMGKAEGEKKTHWSYFGKNGVMYTGWKKMGKAEGEKKAHWSYFGSNGWLRTGWVQLGKGTANPDGNAKKHWSYFGSNGWLRTGWVQFGKGTSEPDGNVAKHWSFFGDNGWLRTGWQNMGKGTSNPDGNSKKHKSYFGGNGWLRTGVQTINGKKYHFDNKGWLKYSDAAIPPKEQPENVMNGIYNIEVRYKNGAHLYLPSFSTGFYEGMKPFGNFGWDFRLEGSNRLVYWNFVGDKVYSGQKYFKINTNKLHVTAHEAEIDIAVKSGNSVPANDRYNTYRKIGKSGGKIYYIEFSMPESWRSVWNYYDSQYYNEHADKIVSSAWVE